MMANSNYWNKMIMSYGIKNEDHVIVYDFSDLYSSCRLWFALKYFGHEKVSVLNGGMKKWLKDFRTRIFSFNVNISSSICLVVFLIIVVERTKKKITTAKKNFFTIHLHNFQFLLNF